MCCSEIYVVEVIKLIEVKEIAAFSRDNEIDSSVTYFANRKSQIFIDLKNIIEKMLHFNKRKHKHLRWKTKIGLVQV